MKSGAAVKMIEKRGSSIPGQDVLVSQTQKTRVARQTLPGIDRQIVAIPPLEALRSGQQLDPHPLGYNPETSSTFCRVGSKTT
jgi:hypothetical protein